MQSTSLLWYSPNEGFYGEDRCVYKACEGAPLSPPGACDVATISITVAASENDPVANDDTAETQKNIPVDVYPLNNDMAVEEHKLAVTKIVGGDNGEHGECVVTSDEVVMYVPEPGYVGLDKCRYQACDDRRRCTEATIEITVAGESDEPCNDNTVSMIACFGPRGLVSSGLLFLECYL